MRPTRGPLHESPIKRLGVNRGQDAPLAAIEFGDDRIGRLDWTRRQARRSWPCARNHCIRRELPDTCGCRGGGDGARMARAPCVRTEKTEEGIRSSSGRALRRDAQAFHDWDKVKEIPAVCSRCHGAEKIPEYLKEGKNTPAQHAKNGFACTNCHADMVTYERHKVAKVNFASGISVDTGNNDANLCMTCHQGRESTASLNKAIAGLPLDTPDPKLGFVHVHYFPAGAVRYGTEAKVGYEYTARNMRAASPICRT